MAGWDDLSAGEIQVLADALRAGRLPPQPSAFALSRLLGSERAEAIAKDFAMWNAPAVAVASLLDLLAAERTRVGEAVQTVDLVWTGPAVSGLPDRDTGAVMRQLFVAARKSVFLAGYAIHRGDAVFRLLAERMDRESDLDVRMVVDIQRDWNDTTVAHDLVYQYAAGFRQDQWPGLRRPQVFYDPRSLALDPVTRSAMHAKCIVIDGETAFVTSANFTTAAQTKNIEVGALVRQSAFASELMSHFDGLVRAGTLRPLPL